MSGNNDDPAARTAASLLSGILGDLQSLVQQQLLLMRREVEIELRQCATAGMVFGFGAALLLLGGVEFCLAASHLLHWAALPAGTDPARLPLWGCHAAVGAAVAFGGGILTLVGRATLKRNTRKPSDPLSGMLKAPLK
jgi:hypothetical protein